MMYALSLGVFRLEVGVFPIGKEEIVAFGVGPGSRKVCLRSLLCVFSF